MVDNGALLLLTGSQHLGGRAGAAACPANTAVETLGGIARITTARGAIAKVEELIGAVTPITIKGQTGFTIDPHPFSLVLRAQAAIEPRNEL